jgi:hypothetical protein
MLEEDGGVPPAGRPVSHLFVVGVEAGERRRDRQEAQRFFALARQIQEQRKAQGQGQTLGQPSIGQLRESMATLMAAAQQEQAAEKAEEVQEQAAVKGNDTFEERQGLIVSLHPSIERRLKRLVKMGASAGDADPRLRFG